MAAPTANDRAVWLQELFRLGWRLALGALLGAWFGHFEEGLLIALALYLAVQLQQLIRLRIWLKSPKRLELPEVGGLWGEVFEGLLDQQRRHRKRKQQLGNIVAQFQASTAALPDGAVVLGVRGDIVWFNLAAQALLGLRSPQDTGLRVVNLLRHPEFTRYFADTEYPGEVEVPSPIKPGVTLMLRVIPYGNDQRLMIVRDVSDRQRLEIMRRDFVANASHELRTPLTVLHGYLDMMQAESAAEGELAAWRAPLAEMRKQSARMEALIDDLLRLARLESAATESLQHSFDPAALMAQLLDDARALSRGRHQIEGDVATGVMLFGREADVQSIINNLLSNAVQYSPGGGRIDLRWWSDAEAAHLSVTDTGMGIAAPDLPRLTERFYRVDAGRSRASGGTGLGLAIVKHALEQFEARLEIRSEVGKGSCFTCHFPLQRLR